MCQQLVTSRVTCWFFMEAGVTEKKKVAQFIPMTSTQAAIGGGALIGTFALWFLWAAVGDKFIFWIGGKANLSGWVQAFGSMIAICVAIYVPYKIQNNQIMHERKTKLQIAKSIFPSVWIKIKPLEEYSNMLKHWLDNNGNFSNKFVTCDDNVKLLEQISMVSFEEVVAISQVNPFAAKNISYIAAISNAILFKLKVYVANNMVFPEESGVIHLRELNDYLLGAVADLKRSKP